MQRWTSRWKNVKKRTGENESDEAKLDCASQRGIVAIL